MYMYMRTHSIAFFRASLKQGALPYQIGMADLGRMNRQKRILGASKGPLQCLDGGLDEGDSSEEEPTRTSLKCI